MAWRQEAGFTYDMRGTGLVEGWRDGSVSNPGIYRKEQTGVSVTDREDYTTHKASPDYPVGTNTDYKFSEYYICRPRDPRTTQAILSIRSRLHEIRGENPPLVVYAFDAKPGDDEATVDGKLVVTEAGLLTAFTLTVEQFDTVTRLHSRFSDIGSTDAESEPAWVAAEFS